MGGALEGGRGNRESQTVFRAEAALTRVNSSHRETPPPPGRGLSTCFHTALHHAACPLAVGGDGFPNKGGAV